MNITNNETDKYLYRYMPFNQNSLKILIDQKFYLSSPDLLNDPFEGDFIISNYSDLYNEDTFKILLDNRPKDGIEWLDKNTEDRLLDHWKKKENERDFQLYLEEYISNTIKRRFGTISFSKNCNSILMWSHYADSHKGFVIVFNREALTNQYDILNSIIDVEYKGVPEIEVNAKDLSIKDDKTLFKYKLPSWEKEDEVRIIKDYYLKKGYENDLSRLMKFPIKSIVGVIYGSRISPENMLTIDHLLCHIGLENLESYYAKKSDNKDEIIFEDITYWKKKNSSN